MIQKYLITDTKLKNTRVTIRRLFRDWANDYLTLAQFAIDHDMSRVHAYRVIDTGRKLQNRRSKNVRVY